MFNMKLPNWMKFETKVKQGIPQPKPLSHEQMHPEEYETYVDPSCGCTKTRRKNTKQVDKEIKGLTPKRGRKPKNT